MNLPCKQSCQGKAARTGRPCRRPGTPHTPGRPGHRSPARSPKGETQQLRHHMHHALILLKLNSSARLQH